jgi:hypothetical protein
MIFCVFVKVMARYSPLDEAMVGMMEVGNMDEAVVATELERALKQNPTVTDGERRPTSPDTDDILSEGGSGSENSWTYYFESSTITVGKIKEMAKNGYFSEDEVCTLGAETVPEPKNDEVVVYKDFFH